MGKLDAMTKEYVGRPEVFADLFNQCLFGGKQVIDPKELTEINTTEMSFPVQHDGKALPQQKLRDVLKRAVIKMDDNAVYVINLGIENQTHVDYLMPLRVMTYDTTHYSKQASEIARRHKDEGTPQSPGEYLSGFRKNDKLRPVITLVFYLGTTPWDGPMSLHDILDIKNPELQKYIANYGINLVDPNRMTLEDADKFKTDLRQLMKLIQCSGDKELMQKVTSSDESFKNMDWLTAQIANEIINAKFKLPTGKERRNVNMCKAIEEIREDGRLEGEKKGLIEGEKKGRAEGRNETLYSLVCNGDLTLKRAAEIAGSTQTAFRAGMRKAGFAIP